VRTVIVSGAVREVEVGAWGGHTRKLLGHVFIVLVAVRVGPDVRAGFGVAHVLEYRLV